MSTHCSIAVQCRDGSVVAVYCHFDGYLSGVGNTLVTEYDNLGAAQAALAALGDPSKACVGMEAFSEGAGPHCYQNYDAYLWNVDEDINAHGYHYIFRNGDWYCHGSACPGGNALQLVEVALAAEDNF